MKRGLFIVFEGIDGSGTTTQTIKLHDYIKQISKYNDVLTTHEPWKSEEIKKRLSEEKDAFSGGDIMLELYTDDRKNHQKKLLTPNLNAGAIILCDRYHMSTYAYQNIQGVSFEKIKTSHLEKEIINPDLTLFLDVPLETAKQRIIKRGEPLEKFEGNEEFTKSLIKKYRNIAEIFQEDRNTLGKIVTINGDDSLEKVAEDIQSQFNVLYGQWKK